MRAKCLMYCVALFSCIAPVEIHIAAAQQFLFFSNLISFYLSTQGNKTDIIICSYEDHFLVIATQIGSMGTILHARKEEGMTTEPNFSVSVVLGKRDEVLLLACARQIIEHISSSGSSRSLVLSLGLKDHSMSTLKSIVSTVKESRVW
ncbi:unnamed protein product [Cuscuta epithymum]|uniref:Proteasome assembly chaperone 3 n=1 Tax=Cuscuta epithymum TaxID=186058 RepID=A0AAV0D0B6_9ASTE|nr:unnamed protein product [Cuscuta epithymum]